MKMKMIRMFTLMCQVFRTLKCHHKNKIRGGGGKRTTFIIKVMMYV